MDQSVKDRFVEFAKSKYSEPSSDPSNGPEKPMDANEEDEEGTYDIACRLCSALDISEDRADAVAKVLMDLRK